MRDSLGSVVVLAIIVVFITFVSGYMAFNVNYTKAFRMKNKVIDLFEEYNGNCNSSCKDDIKDYANKIGYNAHILECPNLNVDNPDTQLIKKELIDDRYCVYRFKVSSNDNAYCSNISGGKCLATDVGNKYYYRILTIIDIRIPIIQNVLGLNLLSVTGDTMQFRE